MNIKDITDDAKVAYREYSSWRNYIINQEYDFGEAVIEPLMNILCKGTEFYFRNRTIEDYLKKLRALMKLGAEGFDIGMIEILCIDMGANYGGIDSMNSRVIFRVVQDNYFIWKVVYEQDEEIEHIPNDILMDDYSPNFEYSFARNQREFDYFIHKLKERQNE